MKNWNYRLVHALMLMSVWVQVFVVAKWTRAVSRASAKVEKFLSGQHSEFIDELTNEMQQAAEMLDFERAGRIKEELTP